MRQPENYTPDLVKYRMETAKENLRAAKALFDIGAFKDSNNRAYYSIFHSIQAVQAMDGQSYRKHKDALGNFNKEYVKTGIFPRELGRRINQAAEIRNASDYDDFYLASKIETEEQIQTAADLLEKVTNYCEERKYGEKEK